MGVHEAWLLAIASSGCGKQVPVKPWRAWSAAVAETGKWGGGAEKEKKGTHNFGYFCGSIVFCGKLFFVNVRVRRGLMFIPLQQMTAQAELVQFSGVLWLY
jgi:hypothetical protein